MTMKISVDRFAGQVAAITGGADGLGYAIAERLIAEGDGLAAVFSGGADDAHDLVYDNGWLYVTAQNSPGLVVVRAEEQAIREAAAAR